MFGILTILVVPFFLASIPSSRGNLLFESPNVVSWAGIAPRGIRRIYFHRDGRSKLKDDIYEQPVNLMNKKSPHDKDEPSDVRGETNADPWTPFDFSKFDNYLNNFKDGDKQDPSPELNRIKRRARRRRGRGGRRRGRQRATTSPPDEEPKNGTSTEVPVARAGEMIDRKRSYGRSPNFDMYQPPGKDWEAGYVEMPKDLYQAHLRPGVIFRIHMSEAILKMQYRNYGEDKDESVIEADVEYLRLTRKVINDEITKFEDLQWLIGWFHNRSSLIQEHMCNTRYYTVGTPPTMFTHPEEYMKRLCLFDSVYIDHIPYVVGEDSSLMAAVAPPVLHCDAATCTSVPFIDSVMFDERLPRTNVRTLTRCQASCRAHCRNDPDCLKRCSDRCLRSD
ncbi:uncharacterized protein LOC118278414 isoform X1 [Spodoptera frugiperda]|uniref:Uncharacterized protein LOC118278414 isoform X1 n=2 Tax=Spodoptera frugiperda TaxID=7108 RepID=A0A9R0E615_SPOFR|nr:uncharacterized protein LOC118278414 isoform X1 [Spodoptera frugiperda]